ncbi:Cullin-associated NEDD8-dissociated protein 2 [Coemansia sp. RSA 1813]|nr:Cullin-associated NEDD8-dissociated protein 2 [Coemansia sp. RSA 1843]KAJ2089587.1 Cullin-associated NEDD8-dissociated protein 2 [Coemansia sp. RSA 986]KAJ2571563.1 Cullin-associated NEDD8-dissociated protein 2 [Coemansia sp. RSA 1813]
MGSNECQSFLDKVADSDVDIRIVAITDLITSLKEKTENISNDDARKYTDSLFKCLGDSQSYVQSLSTECLAACIKVIDIAIAVDIVRQICKYISTQTEKDNPSAMSGALRLLTSRIAMKPDDKTSLAQLAIPITDTLKGSSALTSDVVVDIFTALIDVLTYAGAQIANDVEALDRVQSLLLKYIGNKNTAISRRAVTVLGTFVVSVPGEQSQKALDVIFQRYNDAAHESDRCMMLRVIVTIARQKPELIRDRVSSIINDELQTVNEADNELRVASLLAFKTFVASTPDLANLRLKDIYDAAIEAAQFDPSYNYDDDEDGEDEVDEMDTGSEDGLDDEFDEDIYEDNEDVSWDIRLSGVKLLSTIAESELYAPETMVQDIGSLLVKRFKEHEDVVRAEILFTYAKLLATLSRRISSSQESSGMDVDNGASDLIKQQIPLAVSSLLSSIKAYPKHMETKQLGFVILTRFVPLSIVAVDGILSKILPFVLLTLETSDTAGTSQAATTGIVKPNIKIDALDFLLEYAKRTELSAEADEFLFAIKDKITGAASSNLVMVQASAYNASSAIVKLLRLAADASGKKVERYLSWVSEITELAIKAVGTQDSSLYATLYPFIGVSLQQFGDLLDDAIIGKVLLVLTEWSQGIEKMQASMNALLSAVTKPTHLSEKYVLEIAPSVMSQASEKLQSSNVKSQQPALVLIRSLSEYNITAVNALTHSTVARIVDIISATPESPPLMALQAFSGMCAQVSVDTIKEISPRLLASLSLATVYDKLSASAMNKLYRTVGKMFPDVVQSWETILVGKWVTSYVQFDSLRVSNVAETAQVQNPINRLPVLAKGIIALRDGYCEQKGGSLSERFMPEALGKTPKTVEEVANVCLNLRALGYLAIGNMLEENKSLYDRIYVHIQSSNADIRNEAAFALGNYVGAFPSNFAGLFESAMTAAAAASAAAADDGTGGASGVSSVDRLQAVKTAIECTLRNKPDPETVKDMWSLVFDSAQESTGPMPDILAQCLAMIAAGLPQKFIPQLASCIEASRTQHAKSFFITAFRTLLADKSIEDQCDKEIKEVLPVVMNSISDNDIDIRKLSLLALYTVIQNKTDLFDELANTIQPTLFAQTVVDESLVRIITMGPFKKRVDDGLEARKCAYQCVHMLVRNMPGMADTEAVVDSVIRGVADEQEVRTVVQQIVNESATSFPTAYKARLDDLVDAISAMQAKKIGKNAVKQEIEKQQDMLRLTVGIVHTLEQIFPKQAKDDDSKFGQLVKSLADMSALSALTPNASDLAAFYKEIKSPGAFSAVSAANVAMS